MWCLLECTLLHVRWPWQLDGMEWSVRWGWVNCSVNWQQRWRGTGFDATSPLVKLTFSRWRSCIGIKNGKMQVLSYGSCLVCIHPPSYTIVTVARGTSRGLTQIEWLMFVTRYSILTVFYGCKSSTTSSLKSHICNWLFFPFLPVRTVAKPKFKLFLLIFCYVCFHFIIARAGWSH